MKKEKFENEEVKNVMKNEESKLYIFYNLSKGKGIKRMSAEKPSDIRLGEVVKIDNEFYILQVIIDEEGANYINIPTFRNEEDLEVYFELGMGLLSNETNL